MGLSIRQDRDLIHDADDHRSYRTRVEVQDLTGPVAFIDDQNGVAGSCLGDVDRNVVITGLIAVEIKLIDEQQFMVLQMVDLDRRNDRADDSTDIHASFTLTDAAPVCRWL